MESGASRTKSLGTLRTSQYLHTSTKSSSRKTGRRVEMYRWVLSYCPTPKSTTRSRCRALKFLSRQSKELADSSSPANYHRRDERNCVNRSLVRCLSGTTRSGRKTLWGLLRQRNQMADSLSLKDNLDWDHVQVPEFFSKQCVGQG